MRDIAFRPLAEPDLQAVFLWLLRPHVAKWYGTPPGSFAEVVAKYGPRTVEGSAVRAFVIVAEGREAGYIQGYRLDAFPDYAQRLGCGPDAAGLDLFIGEQPFLGWGLGTEAIRRFAPQVVFGSLAADACLAGPVEGNAAGIRAFEKAGFRRWKVVENERGEREAVMRLDRA